MDGENLVRKFVSRFPHFQGMTQVYKAASMVTTVEAKSRPCEKGMRQPNEANERANSSWRKQRNEKNSSFFFFFGENRMAYHDDNEQNDSTSVFANKNACFSICLKFYEWCLSN